MYAFCSHRNSVCCTDLRTNSNYSPKQYQMVVVYNQDGMCLLRGNN